MSAPGWDWRSVTCEGMTSAQPPGERYQTDLEHSGFYPDASQAKAVQRLQLLYDRLIVSLPQRSLFGRLTRRKPDAIKGLYLWGGPGRGKTYLMDGFYQALPLGSKRRVHFHRFMLAIHEKLDSLPKTPDPLKVIAQQIAEDVRVLCIDEFHVTDIADAMLLSGLLDTLFDRGVTLVATSNIAPWNLYRDGLQRELFSPAIGLIERYTDVCEVNGEQDFRLLLLQQEGTYLVADGGRVTDWMRQHFHDLAAISSCSESSLTISKREFTVQAVAEDVIWFAFDELCMKPRSSGDFIEIASEFHTLLLEGVPVFDEDMDEAARRFMHLIDALYDHSVKLIASAAALPGLLYQAERLAHPFERTASRLQEMSSSAYLARPHRV